MDEKTFNLIFNSRSVRSVHHRVAIEAVRYLDENMANLFLKHYEKLLEGAKAPDKKFKDFRNHVCHMPEKWGGAPKSAQEWYSKFVQALKDENWSEAVYNAGVMSHYYADVNHPFHTGQTDEEGLIHSFTEWGAAQIYKNLRQRMTIKPPTKVPDVKKWVTDAAGESHKIYIYMIENFDVEAGQKGGWGKGYNEELRDKISKRIAHAIFGTASLYRTAIEEAGNPDPGEINLTAKRIATRITTPAEWYRRFRERRKRKRRTRRMRREYRKTGRVQKNLKADDKDYMKALHDGDTKGVKLPKKLQLQSKDPRRQKQSRAGKREKIPSQATRTPRRPAKRRQWKASITLDSPIIDAAEVGSATAKRLEQIGFKTVSDFIKVSGSTVFKKMKEELDYTRIDKEDFDRMITETKLMLDVHRLRGHDAVILYAAGIKTKAALAKISVDELWKKVQVAIKDDHVKRYIRRSNLKPDREELEEWIASAKDQ